MSKKFYILRLINLIKKKGFKSTLIRLIENSKLLLNKRYDVLYHVDIFNFPTTNKHLQQSGTNIRISRKASIIEIESDILKSLYKYRNEKILRHQFQERFSKGAQLWLLTVNNDLAGFLWSIKKSPIEHFFFPLTDNDIYFFDVTILPAQRNKNLFPYFIHSVISELKKEGLSSGYLATNNWNNAMIRSMSKTTFQQIGSARKFSIFGKNLIIWKEMAAKSGSSEA